MSAVIRPIDSGVNTAHAADKKAPRFALAGRRAWLAIAVAVLAALAGTGFILAPPSSETTDDAYVQADTTAVAPKVRGLVAEVLVRDNQKVRAGQPLVKIDSEEFDAKVATARADLADAEAGVASAQAALLSLDAEERLAGANVTAAQTSIKSSDAEAKRASLDGR